MALSQSLQTRTGVRAEFGKTRLNGEQVSHTTLPQRRQ